MVGTRRESVQAGSITSNPNSKPAATAAVAATRRVPSSAVAAEAAYIRADGAKMAEGLGKAAVVK